MTLEGVRRVDAAVRDDWEARMHAHDVRVSGFDDIRIDAQRQIAAWLRVGMLVLEAPAELIGVFFPELGLFRWWWSGKEHQIHLAPARLDEAFAHAQKSDLRELLTRQHQVDGEADAAMLCRVAAYFAHATAILRDERGERVSFYAVFAAQARPPRVPDLDIVRTLPPPAVSPKRTPSQPPPAFTLEPPSVREPPRALLAPMLQIAGSLLRRAFRDHARHALLIVNVDTSRDKARFFVTLVVSTAGGDLAAVDTTRELLDAAGTMLADDARSGNGRWRKLVVHLDCGGDAPTVARCEITV